MQCSIKEEVKIRRQEIVEEIKCFRYWGVGHYKWECPKLKGRKGEKKRWYVWPSHKRCIL